MLPENINDEEYSLCNISSDQLDEVQEVLDSCKYISKWDPPNDTEVSNANYRINKCNESKQGKKEILDFKVIKSNSNGEIVGIIEFCYGYPADEYFCITDLEIKKEYQNKGIGQEVVKNVVKRIREINEYSHLYVCVGLLNWPSLRFWTKIGFNKITNIFGDKEYSANTYSSVVLEM